VVYNNIANTATLVADTSNASFPIANILSDKKGVVWRSTTATSASLTMTFATAQVFSCAVLAYNNLTSTATMRVRVFTNTTDNVVAASTIPSNIDGTALLDTLYSVANIGSLSSWGTPITGTYAYSYGNTPIAAKYFTATSGKKIVIDILDINNLAGYLEVSRLICGDYWSPKYNTEYGLSVNIVDSTSNTRSQAGNLITDNGTINKKIDFTLPYLSSADRNTFYQILRINGMRTAVFVSLFPEDTDKEKESIFQIYGKISTPTAITNSNYLVYSSSLSIEEV
jgi:hypothetical protein